jgi:hypothetical protein
MTDSTEDERAAKAREITNAYNRMWKAKNRESIRAYEREYYAKNIETMRETRRRSSRKVAADPDKRAARAEYLREYAKNNPEIVNEAKQRYREKNREKLREAGRERERKPAVRAVRKIQYAATLEDMAGRPRPDICEVCGAVPDPRKGLHFDHCHTHGHFRGWLCRECNLILGHAHDDPARLLKLVAYLERNTQGTSS